MLTSILAIVAASSMPEACVRTQPEVAGRSLYRVAPEVKPQRLADLPPADVIRTVLLREGGCERLSVVRRGTRTPKR